MILVRLKRDTGVKHHALERRLALLAPDLPRVLYQTYLARFYGYYAALEQRLIGFRAWPAVAVDYSGRHKTPQLESDLHIFGHTNATLARLPLCLDLPVLQSPAQVLGCLYVIEGATLGGQIITRHLAASLQITAQSGAAFFDGYGVRTGPCWREFGAALTAAAGLLQQDDAIVANANATFDTLSRWLFAHPALASASSQYPSTAHV